MALFWTTSLTRSPATAKECSRAESAMDVQADPEQEQRPEQHGKDGAQDLPPRVEVAEVVVRGGDCDADDQPDEQQQPGAEDHAGHRFRPGNAETRRR